MDQASIPNTTGMSTMTVSFCGAMIHVVGFAAGRYVGANTLGTRVADQRPPFSAPHPVCGDPLTEPRETRARCVGGEFALLVRLSRSSDRAHGRAKRRCDIDPFPRTGRDRARCRVRSTRERLPRFDPSAVRCPLAHDPAVEVLLVDDAYRVHDCEPDPFAQRECVSRIPDRPEPFAPPHTVVADRREPASVAPLPALEYFVDLFGVVARALHMLHDRGLLEPRMLATA